MSSAASWPGIIEAYRNYLPVSDDSPIVTLKEGNTPLIEAEYISKQLEARVFLKYEGLNPTGSFKDRGMTMALSKAVEEGARAVICASTGNTSASAAAYAARAGLDCAVLIPGGAIALGKLAQALIHGAKVIAVEGNFDQALQLVRKITEDYPIVLVNSLNPYRIEGQKTGAFEICDVLGRAPDYHYIPVGNAGNITAYWQGYREYHEAGLIESLPGMMGWQAEGAAPIVRGQVIENPETLATAIRIGNPASWQRAAAAAEESKGGIDMVSDEEILDAYRLLADHEGIFVEPASAASVAGLYKQFRDGLLPRGSLVVCVLTGHGLKDPDLAVRSVEAPRAVPPKMETILDILGLA
jgi:threonine synthase